MKDDSIEGIYDPLRECTVTSKSEELDKDAYSARKLWFEILISQIETETPYELFKRLLSSQVLTETAVCNACM
ncbi:hypothetical protein SLEP1_g57525 [Rubroshorea leprosula]|uniref:Uncharacterized protein n=1 Tax=Rubroshorea leprosula TaxID=152421 RepID=A0AAV5MQI2_9ROSI|nr:hypothetical protein SLEP1_g57525 [Rubroshorea leprosula]